MTARNLVAFALLGAFAGLPAAASAQESVKLGMSSTFFTDVPDVVVKFITDPFEKLLKDTTGLNGKLSYDVDALATASQLDAGKLHFGVFYGHEFAWAQKKYPKLKPVVIVSNKEHDVRAYIIVHKDSPIKTLADLRGKVVDFPLPTKEFSRAFVNRNCTDNTGKPVFKSIVKADSPTTALDNLCLSKTDAVLIDGLALAFYKDVKLPFFRNNLRVLAKSDAFPPAVIAYKEGALKDATLKQFRDGLLKAHENQEGKVLMQVMGIDGFDAPPTNFNQMIADTLKAYP